MVNDKNHLFTTADLSKEKKVVDKIRTQQQFSRFSVVDVNAINQASASAAPVALQIDTKPHIGDPINDTIGSIGLITQIIFLDVYGSNYSTMTITDDVTFAFDKIPQGRHILFTLDIVIDKPSDPRPIITLDTRVINPPTLPILTDGLRLVLRFEGVVDDTDTRFTYIGGTVLGTGGQTPWLSNIDAGGFSLNNLLSLDIEDSAGATKLSISGPLGVGARFSFVAGDSVFFTENINDRLEINSGGLDILSGDVIGVDRLQLVQDSGVLILPDNPTIYVNSVGGGSLTINNAQTEAIVFTHSNLIGFQLSLGLAQLQVDKSITNFTRFRQYLTGAVPSTGVSIADHIFSANRTTGGLTDFARVTGIAEDIGNTTFEGGMALQVVRLGNALPEVFIRLNSGKSNTIDFFKVLDMNSENINSAAVVSCSAVVTSASYTLLGGGIIGGVDGDILSFTGSFRVNDKAAPTNPASTNHVFLFLDSATGELSVQKNTVGTVSLESGGGEVFTWTADHNTGGNALVFADDASPPSAGVGAMYQTANELVITSAAITESIRFQLGAITQIEFDANGEIKFFDDNHNIVPSTSALTFTTNLASNEFRFQLGTVSSNPNFVIEEERITLRTEDADTRAAVFQMIQNNVTPADFRTIANILMIAENSASDDTIYAQISASSQDITSTTEDGLLQLGIVSGGTVILAIEMEGSSSSGANDALIGFFGETPVAQQTLASNPTTTQISTVLRALGLTKL